MARIYDMADTWNDSGTVFTAIKMDVTDTASDSSSLLMDLQVGGDSKFSITKSGTLSLPAYQDLRWLGGATMAIRGWSGRMIFTAGATELVRITPSFGNKLLLNDTSLAFRGSDSVVGSDYGDVFLNRDAADILAQRNGTNPQEFRLYGTYTDASNYERGYIKHTGVGLYIGTEASGTGTRRNLYLSGGSAIQVTLTIGQTYSTFQRYPGRYTRFRDGQIEATSNSQDSFLSLDCTDASAGSYVQMTESLTAPSAPSANAVRIYAEDNGSGKTRLMAIFPTGAAQQIAIEP